MVGGSGTRLEERAVVAVAGDGAAKFLAGLVTVELGRLAEAPRHGALLTPQGKILHEFGIHAGDGAVLLDVAAPQRDDLVKRLMFYRLRLKLDIAPRDDLAVVAAWGADDRGLPPDPRLAALGGRAVRPAADVPVAADAADYVAHRIACGVAECGADYGPGEVFPHEADLDALNAVDFDKGCYVGQEVVSRMHHRGTARKRFLPVEGDAALPPPGTEIRDGETLVGTMGSAADRQGLALLRIDRAGAALAAGRGLEAKGIRVTPRVPDWLPVSLAAAGTETPE